MTDKERLEEMLEKRVEELEMKLSINTNNMKQLQKRIEELQLEVNDWRDEAIKWNKRFEESEESHSETKELLHSTISEIKRYKQFIEQFAYCDEDYEGMLRLQNKAKKLIEGENRD